MTSSETAVTVGQPGAASALAAFRDPASVAVVGASADPAKWGHWLARGALSGWHRRSVYLVNQRGAVIDGVRCVPRLIDLPEVPELVALCVPAAVAPGVVDEALTLGVRAFLAVTAGFGTHEGDLVGRIKAAGGRIVGPNCLGLYDASTALHLAWGQFTPGGLGIVTQSGQVGLEIAGLAAAAGIGVSRFVSVGNAADVTAQEMLDELLDHDQTRAVALYLEDFRGGEELVRTVQRLRRAGKPMLLLTVGASAASRTAARSHTGALTSALDVVDAACRAAGAFRVNTPTQLVDVARMLVAGRPGRGRRVAIVGDSGGQGAIAADVLAREGLVVPTLPDAVALELAALLPSGAAVSNPVDLAGAGERDIASYAHALDAVAASDDVDAVLLTGYFGSYGRHTPGLVGAEIEVAGRIGAIQAARELPVVVHSMAPESQAAQALIEHGVPVYGTVDAAARALGGWAELANRPGRLVEPRALAGGPGLAEPARGGRSGFGYWDARALLVDAGVPYPAARLVTDRASAVACAAELRAPYALKADWLNHKSEFGGLALGLADASTVGEAFDRMLERLGPDAAGEVPARFILEEMDARAPAVEIIVGARRDPCFGPTVLVGAGGTEAELYRDTAVELAPVSHDEALAMLRRLRSFPLLAGWRGRPAADLTALTDLVTAVSQLIAERTDLVEVELNPVRVCRDGVLAVDALVTGKEG